MTGAGEVPIRIGASRKLLEFAARDDDLRLVLDGIGRAAHEAVASLESLAEVEDLEYAEMAAEGEWAIIEGLLGAGVVVCQTRIEAVVSRALTLHRLVNAGPPIKRPVLRSDLFRLGEPLRPESPFSKVEVVHALANFFKHRDGWSEAWSDDEDVEQEGVLPSRHWSKIRNEQQRETIRIVRDVGVRWGAGRPLADAIVALGMPPGGLPGLATIFREWSKSVVVRFATA